MTPPGYKGDSYEYSVSRLVNDIAPMSKLPYINLLSFSSDLLRTISYSSLYLPQGLITVHSRCLINVYEGREERWKEGRKLYL